MQEESLMPGMIRKGSGNLEYTEMDDGERILHDKIEQVRQKLGDGKARSLHGKLSSFL